MQLEFVSVNILKLFDDVLGAVWGVVVHNYYFHIDVVLLSCLEQQVSDDGQVLALLVSGHQN